MQKQQALDAANAARAEALRCANETEKKRLQELIEKQKADEQRMKDMKMARNREHAIKQEMQRLSKQDKLDAVERLRRQEEVHSSLTWHPCVQLMLPFAVQTGRDPAKNERRRCVKNASLDALC